MRAEALALDYLMDVDMGGNGHGAPAMPAGLQSMKMTRLHLTKSKNSYGTIVKRIKDPDLLKILATNFFLFFQ